MKIAYLIHYTNKNFEEITENLDQILDAGDDCFLIVNENDLRDDLMLAYADEPRMHIIYKQEAALSGDLSMARGIIMQLSDALEFEEERKIHYDYFINLSDGMIPIRSRNDLEAYLNQHPNQDIYHIEKTSDEDETITKRFEEYAFFTNSLDFQKSKLIRGMNKITAGVIHNFKQRVIDDTLVLTYPWFILTHESAKVIVDNLGYCTDTFKMCLYPEELAIGTMLRKFSKVDHYEDNCWICNEDGKYKYQTPIQNISLKAIHDNPNAFFATKVHSDDNFEIYQNYFDSYSS